MDQRRFVALGGLLAAALALGGPVAAARSATASGGTAGAADSTADHGGDWNRHSERFDYYLALGDSLSVGVQPNASGEDLPTPVGYATDLAAHLRHANRHLDFVDLGCPGESTTTMVAGGCPNPHPAPYTGSQLSAAVSFLEAHRHAHVLVTIDIASNDVDACIGASGIDAACIQAGFQAMSVNLPKILGPLKAAAGKHVEFAAMNYYDPFLAVWLDGPAGQQLATASVQLLAQLNGILETAYKAYGIPVVDVASSFDSTKFTPLVPLSPTLQVPLNVARVCQWTWMCNGPAGPDIHANKAGYERIEDAFEPVVDR